MIDIRCATPEEAPLILGFIRELAEYERLQHEVVATAEDVRRTLFGAHPYAHALLACLDGEPVGYAIYFYNYSTFLCRPGIYVEDVFVRPGGRGHGIGRRVFEHLARLALEQHCGRLEWAVLDWNETAIHFYRRLGATPNDEWTTYRVAGSALERLAAG